MILSVTALEAGINEIAVWYRMGFAGPCPPLPDNFTRQRLSDKWALVPRVIAGVEFNRGALPWQDFSVLVGLRDQLVHFKWNNEQVPHFMRTLQAKDLAIPDDPGVYWADAALTNRTAAWAIATTDAMFAELTRLMGKTNSNVWPWQ